MKRRGFLKLSVFSSALLFSGGSIASLALSKTAHRTNQFLFLSPTDREFVLALAPHILSQPFSHTDNALGIENFMYALDQQINSLSAFSQKQLRQLFDLLGIAPLRYVAGGPYKSWPQASENDIEQFLSTWRDSAIGLKRMGYVSLSKLITMSWYSQSSNFSQAGYPGPPIIKSSKTS